LEDRILIVDDEEMMCSLLSRRLSGEGYSCVTANTGKQALSYFDRNRFSLIISDIKMPGLNGPDAIREIRKMFDRYARKDTPIIFITGFAELGEELNAKELGEIILKPFDLDHLLMTLREYI